MLYPTHIVAGYLLGVARGLPVAAVVAGAALPDLVDKPLAMAGVTAQFHTVAHAGLVLVALVPLATRGRVWLAVAVGWVSHLGLDAAGMVINGRPADVQFLLWPVVDHKSAVSLPPGEFAVAYVGSVSSVVELGIWLAALAVFARRRSRS